MVLIVHNALLSSVLRPARERQIRQDNGVGTSCLQYVISNLIIKKF